MQNQPRFPEVKVKEIRSGDLMLNLINEADVSQIDGLLREYDESEYFLGELHRSCVPRFDDESRRTKYGFLVESESNPAGLCLLGISSFEHKRGYTGADTLPHMRGRGIAPGCKPMLFYLAFELLGLNRVETGCNVSNTSSRRSIEKTPGFRLEGTLRGYSRNSEGEFEDELRYGILRRDWLELYNGSDVEAIAG